MQELTVPPQTTAPYTPAGGSNMAAAPRLGTPIPGTTSSMPMQQGLSVFNNPMASELQSAPQQTAQQMQSYGRNGDSMLVHMTPDEVGGLQQLAMAHGGSLTINPDTGLPEANFLKKLLPTLLGLGLTFIPGIGPLAAAGIVGGGQTLLTGDINKGLMAGLQAFGGASLGGAIAPTAAGGATAAANAAAAKAAASTALPGATGTAANIGAGLTGTPGISGAAANLASTGVPAMSTGLGTLGTSLAPAGGLGVSGFGTGAAAAKTGLAGFGQNFGRAASAGLGGTAAKAAPYLAGYGVLSGLSEASQPPMRKPEEYEFKYEGPYGFPTRRFDPRESGPGGEIQFFDEVNPLGVITRTGQRRYAEGGGVDQRDADAAVARRYGELMGMYQADPTKFAGSAEDKEFRGLYQQIQDISQRQRNASAPPSPPPSTGGGGGPPPGGGGGGGGGPPRGGGGGGPPPGGGGGITSTPAPVIGNINPTMGGVTPGGGGGVTTTAPGGDITSTTVGPIGNINPTMGGVTAGTGTGATLSDRVLSPGATQSGAGLEALRDAYTPTFSSAANYTTAAAPPSTMGADLFSALGQLSSRYGSSPGAITASSGYEGGSPSERIRAAARARAAEINATTPPPAGGAAPSPGVKPTFATNGAGELDFGFTNPMGIAPGAINPFNIGSPEFFNQLLNGNGGGGGGGGGGGQYNEYAQPHAKGGEVNMDNGAFVVDARTVSEMGNGSSNAGIERLIAMGGRPVRGGGDGVSDSVPARIGGRQEARVARDEVIFSPQAVSRLGNGSHSRGTQKLYGLMEKAHKARKKAKRGQDTKVAKGLGALA